MHSHTYPPPVLRHVPPFWQGNSSHSFTSVKGYHILTLKVSSFPKRVFDSTLNAIILVFFNSFLRSFHLPCYCCPCLISLYSLFFLTWNLTYLLRKCEILKSNVGVIWGLIGITLFQRGGYLGSYRYYTVPLTRCLCRKPLLLNYHFAKFTSHLHHSFFHSTVANSCRSILHLCYRKFLRFGTGSVYIDLALKK